MVHFRHILACLKLIHPYLFSLRHIQNPSLFQIILLYLEPQPNLARYVSGIFIHIHNFRHIEAYLLTFGYILADSGIFRFLAQLDIFIYIKAYSEPMAYSGIFRTVLAVSDTTQEQFMHILNLNLTDSDTFRTLTYLGTKCFSHIQAYSQIYHTEAY